MKYVAVFDVPDDWNPSKYDPKAHATFENPNGIFVHMRVELKKLPERIPAEWNTPQAEGFNACLDMIEG